MKRVKFILYFLLLAGALGWGVAQVSAQEGVLLKVELEPGGNYCHMQFPAMTETSLDWDRPTLESSSSGIIDFYGPCDHNPTGKEEVRAQTDQLMRELQDGGED